MQLAMGHSGAHEADGAFEQRRDAIAGADEAQQPVEADILIADTQRIRAAGLHAQQLLELGIDAAPRQQYPIVAKLPPLDRWTTIERVIFLNGDDDPFAPERQNTVVPSSAAGGQYSDVDRAGAELAEQSLLGAVDQENIRIRDLAA
jgi:hypothetical protein